MRTNKIIFLQSQRVKKRRDYSENPFKTKKRFDEECGKLFDEITEKRETRKYNKEEKFENGVDTYFEKQAKRHYCCIKNGAKNGNDNFKIIVDHNIKFPKMDYEVEHRDYAKSSRWYKGYDYETYILVIPCGWNISTRDNILTVYSNKKRTIKGYTVQHACILSRKGLEKCILVSNDNYDYHADSIKQGIKGIERKLKKENQLRHLKTNMYITKTVYHNLTGACMKGINNFVEEHENLKGRSRVQISELLNMEEEFYGKEQLRKLVTQE